MSQSEFIEEEDLVHSPPPLEVPVRDPDGQTTIPTTYDNYVLDIFEKQAQKEGVTFDVFVRAQMRKCAKWYDGSKPEWYIKKPRRDMLERLREICLECVVYNNRVNSSLLKKIIAQVINGVDCRTNQKYFKCFVDYAKATGQQFDHDHPIDVSNLSELIDKELYN